MTRLEDRRARVAKLYELRHKIDSEIEMIEQEVEGELAAMQRARNAARLAKVKVRRRRTAECGTEGGYYRHRRTLKEPACDACKLAHRVAEALRRETRDQVGEPS